MSKYDHYEYKPDLDLIYCHWDDDSITPTSWDRLPFKKFENEFCEIVNYYQLEKEEIFRIRNKVENVCKRLLMACYGGKQAIEEEDDFMIGQRKYGPTLMWDSEIKVLYHLESMILLGRSALDLVAYIFCKLIFDDRIDSFNDLRKMVIKTSNPSTDPLKGVLSPEKEINWVDLISGTKSRSLRDQIAHQTIINYQYWEKEQNSDKLYCHIIIGENKILLDDLVEELLEGITKFCLLIEDIILDDIK